jgi:hypothetical protein
MGNMAVLRNQVLGDPSGKLENVVSKICGPKVVLAKACKNFHKSESEASVAIRNRMIPMAAFAKAVISFPELKVFWKKDKSKYGRTSFNEVQKYNAKYLDPLRPTLKNRLVDEYGYEFNINPFTLNSAGISLEISSIAWDDKIFPLVNQISALFIVNLYDPLVSKNKQFQLFTSRVELVDIPFDQNIIIEIPFSEEVGNIVSSYKKGIVYFILMAKDKNLLVLAHSRNVSAEFDLSDSQNPVKYPNPNGSTTVKLQLSDYWIKNMKQEPFMLSQNSYKNDLGNYIFEFNVMNPGDLVWWIMKLGKGVIVLEPPELKHQIINLANNIIFNYKNDLIPAN